jgi:hypothetical protein
MQMPWVIIKASFYADYVMAIVNYLDIDWIWYANIILPVLGSFQSYQIRKNVQVCQSAACL